MKQTETEGTVTTVFEGIVGNPDTVQEVTRLSGLRVNRTDELPDHFCEWLGASWRAQ